MLRFIKFITKTFARVINIYHNILKDTFIFHFRRTRYHLTEQELRSPILHKTRLITHTHIQTQSLEDNITHQYSRIAKSHKPTLLTRIRQITHTQFIKTSKRLKPTNTISISIQTMLKDEILS